MGRNGNSDVITLSQLIELADDSVKGQPGEDTGADVRREIKRLTDAGMTLVELAGRLKRDASTLGQIASGEIKNPPSSLLDQIKSISTPSNNMSTLPDDVEAMVAGGMTTDFSATGKKDAKGRGLFEKDMLKIGTWTHPSKGWTLHVDKPLMNTLASNYQTMKGLGIEVPVTQDHSKKAKDSCGELTDVFVRGDRLIGVHAIDPEGEPLTKKSGVGTSLEINRNYVTTGRKRLGPSLTANSIVQHPVVSGQNDFVKIAASRESGENVDIEVPVLLLSEADDPSNEPGAEPMDKLIKLLNEKLNLSIADDADEATILASVAKCMKDGMEEHAKVELEKKDLKITALEASLVDAKGDKIEMSTEIRAISKDGLEARLDALQNGAKPKITPGARKLLEASISTDLMLSVGEGNERPRYRGILDAFEINDPVELGEKTKTQELSRDVPDPDNKPTGKRDDAVVGGFFPGGKLPSETRAEAAKA